MEVSFSSMLGKSNIRGKTNCDECGSPCNVDLDAEVQLCVKCKRTLRQQYPKNCYDPRAFKDNLMMCYNKNN